MKIQLTSTLSIFIPDKVARRQRIRRSESKVNHDTTLVPQEEVSARRRGQDEKDSKMMGKVERMPNEMMRIAYLLRRAEDQRQARREKRANKS